MRREAVDEVVLAYSDLSHEDGDAPGVDRRSPPGADFTLLGPRSTMLHSPKPVVAVCATRTGAGKSQTSRRIGRILLDAGLRVALVRHPMPYGDLERMRVQRFASLADIDAADPTIEEREEYELPVELGMVMYAGVDYAAILEQAAAEADVIVWDGGNNDFPFVRGRPPRGRDRPATRRRRASIPPRRDVPSDGRRRGREQGRQRHAGSGPCRCSRRSPRPTHAQPCVQRRVAGHPRTGPRPPRASGAGHRGRPDDHPRWDAVRRRDRRRPRGRRRRDRRPTAVGRRLDRGDVRALPGYRARAPGDGLLARPARRPRPHDPRRPVRRRRHRDAGRSRPAARRRATHSATPPTSCARSATPTSPTCSPTSCTTPSGPPRGDLRPWLLGPEPGTLAGVRYEPIVKQRGGWRVPPNLVDYETDCARFSWSAARRELDGLPAGGLNIAHECVDRHARSGRGDQLAIRWLGRHGETRDFTFADLARAHEPVRERAGSPRGASRRAVCS